MTETLEVKRFRISRPTGDVEAQASGVQIEKCGTLTLFNRWNYPASLLCPPMPPRTRDFRWFAPGTWTDCIDITDR